MSQPEPQQDPPQRLLVQDASRRADVEYKQQQVRNLIAQTKADAVLLQDPTNIAWFTAGADLYRCTTNSSRTSIFITPDARLFATNAVDSAQIFEREAFGLGFQLKQREWFQPHQELIADLCRGRRVLTDIAVADTTAAPDRIASLRQPLSALDVKRLRQLGRVATHAVEATARRIRRGVTEAEVAGEVSHRLIKRTVTPVRIQVCADGRNARFRHWMYGEDPIERYAVISCMARRWGLHVGVSRTVCLDTIPDELANAYGKAVLMHATGQYFSRNGSQLGEIWKKVHRIYEKFDLSSEWQKADQADVIGFTTSEYQMFPDSPIFLTAPTAIYWHPSVGPAMMGDTVLLQEKAAHFVTSRSGWPTIKVQVKGRDVPCPGIFRIPAEVANDRKGMDPLLESIEEAFPSEDEEANTRLDSVWELEMQPDRSVFEGEDSTWSEESVLD